MSRVASEKMDAPKRKPRKKQATPKDLCAEYSFRLGDNYTSITTAKDVFMRLNDVAGLGVDVTSILYLGDCNELKGRDVVSLGQPFPTFFTHREIQLKAVELASRKIVLARIDVSGQLNPTILEIEATRFMYEECKLWEITLLDHLVFCGENYYSFLQGGFLYRDKDKKPQQVKIGLATERMQ